MTQVKMKFSKANATLEYRNDGVFVQPSYRYVSSGYLTNYVANPNKDKRDGISQLGLSVGFPVSDSIDVKSGLLPRHECQQNAGK